MAETRAKVIKAAQKRHTPLLKLWPLPLAKCFQILAIWDDVASVLFSLSLSISSLLCVCASVTLYMYRNGSTVFNTLTGPSNLVDKTCFFSIKGRKNHIQGALIFIYVSCDQTPYRVGGVFTVHIYIVHGQHNLYTIRSQQWLGNKETESHWLMDEPAFFTERWKRTNEGRQEDWSVS